MFSPDISGGPVPSSAHIRLHPRNPEAEDAKSAEGTKMPAERDSPACRPPGRRFPGPLHPGSGILSGPRPQSSPLTEALGGVEPKSHFLPVSHTLRKTAVTGTEKADPAELLRKAMGPQIAGHRDPCPSLPSMHAWARAGYRHRSLRTFPGCWVGVPSGPPSGRPWVASAPYLCTLEPRQRRGHKLPASALAQQWEPPH